MGTCLLGREYQIWRLQHVRAPTGRHLALFHGLQQRCLRLGRGAVDFIGEQHVGEDRPAHETEVALACLAVLLQDVRAGDVRRHQVGRELNAIGVERQGAREVGDQCRLREARHTHQQAVPAGEERREQEVDDLVLTDDTRSQLLENARPCLCELAHACGVVGLRARLRRGCAVRRGLRLLHVLRHVRRSLPDRGRSQNCHSDFSGSGCQRRGRCPRIVE